jgi:hypothetical protein
MPEDAREQEVSMDETSKETSAVDASEESEEEVALWDLAATPLEDLLARANPALRTVLLRHYSANPIGRPSNGRFNSFIEPDL